MLLFPFIFSEFEGFQLYPNIFRNL